MSSTPVFTSSESQKRWRDHMKYNYITNHAIHPCVLQVPDTLRDTKPEAYTPQVVGLGPYHHFRPQLQQMESTKRAAVLDYLDIEVVEGLINLVEPKQKTDDSTKEDENPDKFEPIIRSCYDRYLDLDKDTLRWIVIVDGLFLLHFIYTYLGLEKGNINIYSNIGALVPDIFMLENQIPIILILEMRKVLKQNFTVASDAELYAQFHDFCVQQSPFKLTTDSRSIKASYDKNNHLLHFMYQMIVRNKCPEIDQDNSQSQMDDDGILGDVGGAIEEDKISPKSQGENRVPLKIRIGELVREATSQGGEILDHAIEEFNSALADAKSAGIKVSGNVEKVSNILRNLHKTLNRNHQKDSLGDLDDDIPSASRLNAIVKITFKPLPENWGIADISLDEKKVLQLPVITLRANSEVILRNLVAYEAASKMGSTLLRNYVDLMRGIIKSEKDAKLLRKAGIIKGDDKLLEELVRMCNGITKSNEKPDEKSKVHSTTKEVKEHFNNAGFVKACRSIKKFLAGFVKFVKPLFPILVLVFLAFQSFCEIYDCRRSSYVGDALRNLNLGEMDPEESKLMLPRKMYRYQSI